MPFKNSEEGRKYREANCESLRLKRIEYDKKNREHRLAIQIEYSTSHKDQRREYRQDNKESILEYQRNYRLHPESIVKRREYEKKWYQDHRDEIKEATALARKERTTNCPICGSYETLVSDHDHSTGKKREYICFSCNVAIGHAKDDPAILEKMASYLRKYD